MQTLGFDTYVEPLKLYLQKYREVSKSEMCCEKEWTQCIYNKHFICNEFVTFFFDFLTFKLKDWII